MPNIISLPIIALLAMGLAQFSVLSQWGLSALPLAIMFGIVWGHINWVPASVHSEAFTRFCQQKCLRIGIVLLGLSISVQQILGVGWEAIALNCLVIASVISLGLLIGVRFLGLPSDMVLLISTGSAICGAAAILATESTLKARQQHVAIAVATVVLFGTLAMFFYPLLYPFVDMSDRQFGIYIGSTVHEVAQAVAAGESISPEALHNALVTKLIRVMLLAPFILLLGGVLSKALIGGSTDHAHSTDDVDSATSATSAKRPGAFIIPWFVLGFIAVAVINSLWVLPRELTDVLTHTSQFLLALAMAALGTQTRWSLIRQAGVRPLLLALILFVFLIAGGYLLNSVIIM